MFWTIAGVFALWMFLALVLGIIVGKWLKRRSRILLALPAPGESFPDQDELARVRLAIKNYIDSCRKDEIPVSDRELQPADLCVVCFQEGFTQEEDLTPPFAVVDDHCIPACKRHKAFIIACVARNIFSET